MITHAQGGLQTPLRDDSQFGVGCDGIGDLNSDGVPDAVVTATKMTSLRGSVFTLFLNDDGTVSSEIEIHEDSHAPLSGLGVSQGEAFGTFISSGPPRGSTAAIEYLVGAAGKSSSDGAVILIDISRQGGPISSSTWEESDLSLTSSIGSGVRLG